MRHQGNSWSGVLLVLGVCLVLAAVPGFVAAADSSAVDSSPQLSVVSIRSGFIPGRSRIVFDLDGIPTYSITGLSVPERIVVDIQGARLQAALAPQSLPSAESPHPPETDGRLWPARQPTTSRVMPVPDRQARESSAGRGLDLDLRFSGTVQQEWAYAIAHHQNQKFETLVTPRWDLTFGDVSFTAVARIRLDAVGDLGPAERHPANYSDVTKPWFNHERAQLALREFYADFQVGKSEWRVGKQQVVWGQADGIKVLDVVNPQSFREFILDQFDESRIPLWLANINVPIGEAGNLQLLWIPDTTYHETAELGSPYSARSPRLIPPLPVASLADTTPPDDPLSDGDFGFQLGSFQGGWDFTLNYLYHYLDTPALPVRQTPSGQLVLVPEYRRSHLLGGTASTALGGVTLRSELAYSSDTFQPLSALRDDAVGETPELSTVLGLDWMPNAEVLYSAQWFYSYLADYDSAMARDASEHLLTLLYQQDFANAVWRFRALGIYSPNDGDSLLQLNLSYWIQSNLRVWVGADVFSGTRRGLFGQYADQDRMLLGLEYGF